MVRARMCRSWLCGLLAGPLVGCGSLAPQVTPAADASINDATGDARETAASDPAKVTCGATVCSAPGQACCLDNAGADKACFTADAGTAACGAPFRTCDESSDCPAGKKCCEWQHNAPLHIRATVCESQCDPSTGMVPVCKTDAECGGQACVFVQCRGEKTGFCGGAPTATWCN